MRVFVRAATTLALSAGLGQCSTLRSCETLPVSPSTAPPTAQTETWTSSDIPEVTDPPINSSYPRSITSLDGTAVLSAPDCHTVTITLTGATGMWMYGLDSQPPAAPSGSTSSLTRSATGPTVATMRGPTPSDVYSLDMPAC